MKKIAKKLTAFLLTVILMFSFTIIAYADDGVEPQLSFSAIVTVVSCPNTTSFKSGNGILGHSFIIVSNVGNSAITVGNMKVDVNQKITIGTFGNRNAHKGIWYNIEGYNYHDLNAELYSLSTGLTGTDPASLAKSIKSKSGYSTEPIIPYKSKSTIARQTSDGYVFDTSGATAS